MSNEVLQNSIKKDMRFGMVVSDLAEYLNKQYPDASFMVIGSTPTDGYDVPTMKKYGNDKRIAEALGFWMNEGGKGALDIEGKKNRGRKLYFCSGRPYHGSKEIQQAGEPYYSY